MYRRQFLKACGLTGLLFASNWRTLIRGPIPGDVVKRGVFKVTRSVFAIAGEKLEAGDMVYVGSDGKMYRASATSRVDGVATCCCTEQSEVKIAKAGSVYLTSDRVVL